MKPRFTPIDCAIQGAVLALLLALGAQNVVPHSHAATSHDAEFCTGHLGEHGAPDEDHTAACPLCRTPHRTRVLAPTARSAEAAPSPALFPARSEATPSAVSIGRSPQAPRAPPLRFI